jgi:2-polyprenyl-6-methoxyphenol hydroxylase-like FAD-dependent oxidoreductase
MRIAVIGGGPGGLVAARILALGGVNVTVFEREESFVSRSQGGSLDMHAESGQLALSKAGLTEEFLRIARYEDQEMHVYDKHGKLHYRDRGTAGKDRPETDRGHLRGMLIRSLPGNVIRWDSHVVGLTALQSGWGVESLNGLQESFDMVVGADGTWSKVRPMLSDAVPRYTGITMIEFGIDDVDRRYPAISAKAGRGLTFALGQGKALIAHRDADAHLGGYIGLRVPSDWVQENGIEKLDERAARARICEEFTDWSPDLLDWIRKSEGLLTPRPIYELPPGHRWQHREGITLIGDAAHVMSPFGGDGANLAMLDGAELAEALVQPDWRMAVRAFEERMWQRASKSSAQSSQAIQEVFSLGGLEHMVETLGRMNAEME